VCGRFTGRASGGLARGHWIVPAHRGLHGWCDWRDWYGRRRCCTGCSVRPASASLPALVRLAHHRWAIEQHYQHLKTELGLDHFEGRTYPGWQHHMVISAVADAFLQKERMRGPVDAALTFPALRAIVQEVFTGLLFASRPTYVKWLQDAQAKYHLRI